MNQATGNRVEFVDLRRQYHNIKTEIDAAVLNALARGDYILGEDEREFEREFAEFLGAKYCVGVSDGTDALHLALRALEIGSGDEVIVPANTFIATVLAVSCAGARPILVDCEPDYFQINVNAIESAITPRTKAIIPVHLYGHPADMDPIFEIARRHKLRVIEDAAQAHGASYKGRTCGTMGDIGCFSFYPGKNIGAYGDGGAIVTNDNKLAEQLALLRNWGAKEKYVHVSKGFNARLDTVQAAILRVKLKHLAKWNDQRRAAAARYGELLRDSSLRLPCAASWGNPVWHLYVVQSGDRETLQRALTEENISWGIHYPIPVHLQAAYRDLGYKEGDFPVTERLSTRILSLPVFPEIEAKEQEHVASACRRAGSTQR
jgi:dTDP-4-amino-4,6-dideoxygalactose transaminase